jgi:hypothetical protein
MDTPFITTYQTIVKDTSQLNDRRLRLDTLYVTILTLVLGGEAYIVATSQFDNFIAVGATIITSIVGLAFTFRWRQALIGIGNQLELRYRLIREMECRPEFGGVKVFTQEFEQFYQKDKVQGFRTPFFSRTNQLHAIFIGIFILLPLIFTLLAIAASIPGLHAYIQPIIHN